MCLCVFCPPVFALLCEPTTGASVRTSTPVAFSPGELSAEPGASAAGDSGDCQNKGRSREVKVSRGSEQEMAKNEKRIKWSERAGEKSGSRGSGEVPWQPSHFILFKKKGTKTAP